MANDDHGTRVIQSDTPIYDDDGWLFIEHLPALGITRWMAYDDDGNIIIRTDTEIESLLDANKAERNIQAGQKWGDGKKVASIPLPMWTRELADATRDGDHKYVAKWLNNGDHANVRTFEGKV